MLTWLGGILYRVRWAVLICALLLTIVMGWYGSSVFDSLRSTGLTDPSSESARAQKLINDNFSTQSSTNDSIVLLLSHPTLTVDDPPFAQATAALLKTLRARPEVQSLSSYYSTHSTTFVSYDRHQTFVALAVSTKNGAAQTYHTLVPLLTSPTLHVEIGGPLASDIQFNDQLRADLQFAETITLPIVALLLVLIFSGIIAALLPLLIGGFAIVGAFALLRVLTLVGDVSSFATNVITIIGLGLAIDYSLFIVTRFREELAPNPDNVRGALQRTMATAGRTVLFSGLTVCTSLLSLLTFPVNALRSIGLATIVAALVAMLGTLTLLPAILAILGTRVNALSLQHILRSRKSRPGQHGQGVWYHLSYAVMRWRLPIALTVITFLLFLGTPFLHASFASADERSLPLNVSARTVTEQLQQHFPAQNNAAITIAVRTRHDALVDESLQQLDAYVRRIQIMHGVRKISSPVSLAAGISLTAYQQIYTHPELKPQIAEAGRRLVKGNLTVVTVNTNLAPHADAVRTLVQQIRALPVPAGFTPLVGGPMAQEIDQAASLENATPRAVLLMAAAIFVLLFLMTGSLIMPLKAILLNTLSLTATFGAMVWVFQDGHLQNLLHFKAFGALDSTQPILIFAIAFGLSMDYEVFLLSRIKEQFDKTGNNSEAVATGLQRTGWLITSAAMLLAVVVAAFMSSHIIFIQEIGLGISLAILMDATLVRALLVPAMMALLGTWNWWAPRPLKTLWLRIGLRETAEAPEADQDVEPTLVQWLPH
ncbi:MAG TPA: MMPL family transporter [Ktedonobacteraceae bacterium]|nr:MMPL family transporter [Ktedonobacteraceae bacterium]